MKCQVCGNDIVFGDKNATKCLMCKLLGRGDASSSVSPAQESTNGLYQVRLISSGDKKLNVIKVIRETCVPGLKEAKDLAEGCPSILKTGLTREQAETLKAKLENVGAVVQIEPSI